MVLRRIARTPCVYQSSSHRLKCVQPSIFAYFLVFLIVHHINCTSHQTTPISLLFTTYHDIRLANITRPHGPPTSIEIIAKDLPKAGALDFHYEKQLVCWSDQTMQRIQCMKLNGTHPTIARNVITSGLENPEGIAIDWCTDKIYWTDGDTNRIEVATMDGKHRKLLFWSELDQPRAITLVPSKALLIWSDWGDNPKIESASMDGNPGSRAILVNKNIVWPNGLTVDVEKELIYWVDGNLQILDVMHLDGSNRRTLVKDAKYISYPYSVSVAPSHSRLYWTDWKTGSIHTHDLTTNETREILGTAKVPLNIHVWDKRLQASGDNPCRRNNGNCSHLCLLSSSTKGYTCACPTGLKLLTATKCADELHDMLFLVQNTQISRISLDSSDYVRVRMQMGRIRSAVAIDYDPVEEFVYWSEEKRQAIRRARFDGSARSDIVTGIEQPDGIAVDSLARNLYWTDAGTDRIEVCRLDGTSRKVLIHEGLREPRAIAVSPTRGWIFWTDWNEAKPKIERASLDGSQRTVVVTKDLGWPNGLALDHDAKKVYWCDAKTDRIEMESMDPAADGSIRTVIVRENLPHAFGFSLLGDYLYWSDWERKSINRASKHTGNDRVTIVDHLSDLMGIKVARLKEVKGSNPCAIKNGNCSHLCFNRPADYVCRCPFDYELARDRRSCIVPPAFLLLSKLNTIKRISVDFNDDNSNDNDIPFKDIQDAHSTDVDMAERRVYWIDQRNGSISRAFMNGSDVQAIVFTGLMQPESIAVDWVARNIFWTDLGARRIEAARMDGSRRRIIVSKGIEEPRSLVVDSPNGFMYWVEWPSDSIRRAALDGSDLTTVVSAANRASGLTLDLAAQRLYWACQARPAAIESADWDGKNRHVVVSSNIFEPYAVTVYEDYVYWSDWSTGDIRRALKMTGDNQTLVHRKLDFITSLLVYRESPPTGTNACRANNGGCQHLCLALPNGRAATCLCSAPFVLAKDNVSCFLPKNYVIYSQQNSFGRLLTNTSDTSDAQPIPVPSKSIRAIEYDSMENATYWIDGDNQTIYRSFDNDTIPRRFLVTDSQPFDLSIDIIGRLLFYTCSSTNTINVTSLNGVDLGTVNVSETEQPRGIVVHSMKRLLFWTDMGSQQSINRARIDGADRSILAYNLSGIVAIAVDQHLDLLFFAYTQRIDVMDLDGRNHRNLVSSQINQLVALAALSGYCYWLDTKTGIERVTITGEGRRSELQQTAPQITDIVAVSTPDAKAVQAHACTPATSNCSHFCVATYAESVHDICSCPHGLTMLEDRRRCGRQLPACGPRHFTCAALGSGALDEQGSDNGKECIPFEWRCDGQSDCADQSDEMGCPSCQPDQFRCPSGECIERALVCDGTTHCKDGNDEANCCERPEDFQCPSNKVCIPPELLCDGWDNCADQADESEEVCSAHNRRTASITDKKTIFIVISMVILIVCLIAYASVRCTQFCRTKLAANSATAHKPMSTLAMPDNVRMSTLNSRCTTISNSYDRNNITGASSPTTNDSVGYPQNPPPSPEESRASSYRAYNRNYKKMNKPPPPSPCSTDICTDVNDESDEYRCRSARPYATHDYRMNLRRNDNGTRSVNSLRRPNAAARYHYDRVPPPTPGLYSDYQAPESSCPSPISAYFSPPPPPSPQRL